MVSAPLTAPRTASMRVARLRCSTDVASSSSARFRSDRCNHNVTRVMSADAARGRSMSKRLLLMLAGVAVLGSALAARSAERVHELKPSPATVHRGFFDATLKPVLTIDSGDVV